MTTFISCCTNSRYPRRDSALLVELKTKLWPQQLSSLQNICSGGFEGKIPQIFVGQRRRVIWVWIVALFRLAESFNLIVINS